MKQTEFFKRLLAAVLLIVMALSALPVAQAEVQHGYVLLPGLGGDRVVNFRRDPNTDDNGNYPIARLPEYWVVEILAIEYKGTQKWFRVKTNTGTGVGEPENIQTGYVMADYIKVMTAEEEAAFSQISGSYYRPGVNMSNPKTPDSWADGEHAYVKIPGLGGDRSVNFRRDPNTDDNANYPIARLPEYWVVVILDSQRKGSQLWYHVQTNTGVGENDPVNYQTGYVMADYIKVMTAEEEAIYSLTLSNYFRPGVNYLAENGMRTSFDSDTPVTESIPYIIPTGTVLGYVYIINGDAEIYGEASGTPIGVSIPRARWCLTLKWFPSPRRTPMNGCGSRITETKAISAKASTCPPPQPLPLPPRAHRIPPAQRIPASRTPSQQTPSLFPSPPPTPPRRW